MLVVTMSAVAETFKTFIYEIIHETDFKQVSLMHAGNANVTYQHWNPSIHKPENRCNINLQSHDTLTSRANPSRSSQLFHYVCCSWIFDKSHQYKTKNSVGWQIVMNAKIGFKLQGTATSGFHSLCGWYYQTMWLFSGAPDNPRNDTVMEYHGIEVFNSAV